MTSATIPALPIQDITGQDITGQDITAAQEANRRAAIKWGSFVVLLLASQVAIGVAAIVLAGSDPSVAVVPGYHQKAMLWDKSVEQRQISRDLGWQVTSSAVSSPSAKRIHWQISDRDGNPLPQEKLRGNVVIYHHARAGEPIQFRIEDRPTGIDVERAGYWQIEMTLDTDDPAIKFFDSQRLDVKS